MQTKQPDMMKPAKRKMRHDKAEVTDSEAKDI